MDDSRLVPGLGKDKPEEKVTTKMPEGMAGVVRGASGTGFFEQLARGNSPELPKEGDPVEVEPVSESAPTEQVAPAPAPQEKEKVVIPDTLEKPQGEEQQERKVRPDGRCEHCGMNLSLLKPGEPTDTDKREFVAYALGAGDFTRKYKYMGGSVVVTMRTRTAREGDAVLRIMRRLVSDKKVPEMPITMNESYVYNMQRILASVCLSSIEYGDKKTVEYSPDWRNESDDDEIDRMIVERHTRITNEVTEAVMSVILHSQRAFDTLVDLLVRRASDPDFYSPIDG